MTKKIYLIPIVLVLVAIVFGGGFYAGRESAPRPTPSDTIIINRELGQPGAVDFSFFWEALKKIEKYYVDSENLDYQEMVYGAISGMTESLGDDYTVFMKPKKTEDFLDSVETGGNFEGVGMEIAIKGGILTVVAPLERTPAMRAGIKAGDKILKIDDTFSDGLLLEEAVDLIRGEKGTEVVLTISRSSFKEPQEIIVIRDVIQIPIAEWKLVDDHIAHIKIYHFTGNLPLRFQNIASEIINSKIDKIVLDLRNNPGGYLDTAIDIASWFIPKGEIVAIEATGNKENNKMYRSKGYKGLQNFPIVVLINKGSASASEIVAGALRDIREIKLIGEKSFGKGSIQTLERLRDGSSLKITTAKWLTPSQVSISEEGLEPDIEVELTDEDFDNDEDPQLNKALEIIKSL